MYADSVHIICCVRVSGFETAKVTHQRSCSTVQCMHKQNHLQYISQIRTCRARPLMHAGPIVLTQLHAAYDTLVQAQFPSQPKLPRAIT